MGWTCRKWFTTTAGALTLAMDPAATVMRSDLGMVRTERKRSPQGLPPKGSVRQHSYALLRNPSRKSCQRVVLLISSVS